MATSPTPKKSAPGAAVWLALGNVVLTAVLAVLVVQWRGENVEAEQARARDAVTAPAHALAQSVGDDLVRIDGVLKAAIAAFEREPVAGISERGELAQVLQDLRAGLAEADVLVVCDAAGDVRLGRPAGAAAVNLGARDFFLAAKAAAPESLPVVSKPWIDPVSGKWGISIARPLRAPDGAFVGTVHADLGSAYLARRLAGMPLGPDGVVALRTLELALVARMTTEGVSNDGLGSTAGSGALKKAVTDQPAGGHFESRSPRDGVVRAIAYRRVPNFPLYVIVGQGTQDAPADVVAKP